MATHYMASHPRTAAKTRKGFFSDSEFEKLLPHLPEEIQPLIEFLWLTGWRKSEALNLEWAQVDFQSGNVRLDPGTTKNDEWRTFPFRAYPALEEFLIRQTGRTEQIQEATAQIIPRVFFSSRSKKDPGFQGSGIRPAGKRDCRVDGCMIFVGVQ